LGTLLVLLVTMALVMANRQNLIDWWRLRTYDPPAAVVALADQDTMTDYARKVFYVNRPQIEGKAAFNKSCPDSTAEQTIVLGCYHGNQGGIFLFNVSDERLAGVEQVTAAHEMLHAAYDRLDAGERNRVDKLLENYYRSGLTDERIKKTIDAYKVSEPHDVVNEMHSIFGTEVANLPSDLETYYKQYFTNRTAITDAAAAYQAEFTSRQDQVAQTDAQLANLKTQIDSLQADIKNQQQTINDEEARLKSLRDTNVSAYNAAVPAYNQQIDAYNSNVQQVRSLIDRYNTLVAHRNAIAFEESQLIKSLDSNANELKE
jgi:hypothetical protein